MASSSTDSKYPQLLYQKGKAPSQKKSMSFYSYLSNFQMVQVGVGNDAWDALKESSVGVFLSFYEQDHIFSAKLVHYILTHQLVVKKKYEIWSLIDCQPIRLSLTDFGEITGLNIGPFDVGDTIDVDHSEFWEELHVSPAVGPNLVELREVLLSRCKSWSFETRRSLGWLCILHIAVYGIAPTARIPLETAKRVLNADAFQRYPWGRVACKSLIHSIKCLNYQAKESYTVEGFVYVLQIWAYEAITGIGELHGNRIAGRRVPMLSWGGSRPRFEPDEFIRHEKEAHDNKVRVRHFLSLGDGNVVPNWDNEEDDENVTLMVRDILDDHISPDAWDVCESQVRMRKKRKVSAPIIDSNYSTNPEVKDQQTNADNEKGGASNAPGNVTQDNDSILALVEDDKEIKKICRPFAKLLPVILNAMVPSYVRKRSAKLFDVRRLKLIPQNQNPGDCGVYTIKYIECLALGVNFDGLNDVNIPQLRRKLAAEIFDEVGLPQRKL